MLKTGDRVRHRFNQDLGPGLVVEVEGRRTTVLFPEGGETLIFAAGADALEKLVLRPGGRARMASSGEVVEVERVGAETSRVADGREVPNEDLWPLPAELSVVDRLARGETDAFEDFRNRLDAFRIARSYDETSLVAPDDELHELVRDVVLRAAERLGLRVDPRPGKDVTRIQLGNKARVQDLQGVVPGRRYVGSFDRDEAAKSEGLDRFALGHPLVDGILLELESGKHGRVAMVQAPGEQEEFGLLALYKEGEALGEGIEAVAVDARGRQRPDLAERLVSGDAELEPVRSKRWSGGKKWSTGIHRLARKLPADREPRALAAFRIRPG